MKNYFSKKKYEMLAAIYYARFKDVSVIYNEVWHQIDAADLFAEADQKEINQIQHLIRTFSDKISANYNIKTVYEKIRKKNAEIIRKQVRNVEYITYDRWKKRLGLTEKKFKIMLKTVAVFQISIGCSVYCRRCNEWALPGVRAHFDFDAIKRIMIELKEAKNFQYICYGASDPLDWWDKEKNIIDIVEFARANNCSSEYGILTKVPKGSLKIAEEFLKIDADIGVSITQKNRLRINTIEEKIGKKFQAHHNDESLLIPAGLDEDFVSIKSSITDNYGTQITPDGASLVIPAFTSALNLTGQSRINITKNTEFFIKRKTGRDALPVEYFKPLQAIDYMGNEFTTDKLLDGQIENILLDDGSENVSPPGMMNMSEYFKTFEYSAVLQRKKLFPSVLKKMKTEILDNGEKYNSVERINIFRQRIFNYLCFCRIESVMEHKKDMFAFYLKAIRDYLKKYPVKREIILFLRKKDKNLYKITCSEISGTVEQRVDFMLEKAINNNFYIFQSLIFLLLDNPENRVIKKFLGILH